MMRKNPSESKIPVLNVKIFVHQTSSVLLTLSTHGCEVEGIGRRSPLSGAVLMGPVRRQQERILLLYRAAHGAGDSTAGGVPARARAGFSTGWSPPW